MEEVCELHVEYGLIWRKGLLGVSVGVEEVRETISLGVHVAHALDCHVDHADHNVLRLELRPNSRQSLPIVVI